MRNVSSYYTLNDKKWLFTPLFCLMISSCGGGASSPNGNKNLSSTELKNKISAQLSDYDIAVVDKSFNEFCSRYSSFDDSEKADAIASFYVSVSTAESNRNPFLFYYEKPLKSYSVGLFSLSYEDNDSYGCHFDAKKDDSLRVEHKSITNINKQIECLLLIHKKLLGKSQTVKALVNLAQDDSRARGDARKLKLQQKLSVYWSVLQKDRAGYQRLKAALKKTMPRSCAEE